MTKEIKDTREIRIIARKSPLSLLQVDEVFKVLPGVKRRLVTLDTYGDRHREVSLMDNIPQDFFTRELDARLLDGEADISVNSAKDLPYPLPPGLRLYALFASRDKSDSLVSRDNLTLDALPAGARVGTSSSLRKANLQTLRPDLTVVPVRGNIEERIALVDSGEIDALIVATCALERLGLTRRIAQRLPFKTHPLQGNLAVIGPEGHDDIARIFAPFDISARYGRVTLAGFGPGRPDLLTVAALRALEAADVIFYDALVDEAFVKSHFNKAEKIFVGKRAGRHSLSQDEINELVYEAAAAGRNVVRLKGGDPMIFAHGREEFDYLESRFVKVDVIPGVTAAVAMAAFTHIPLTHRGMAASVAFATGHTAGETKKAGETQKAGKTQKAGETQESESTPVQADTLVYYMGGSRIAAIARQLMADGRSPQTPVALVSNVSRPDQKTLFSTLDELGFSVMKLPTPVLMVVGDTVALEAPFHQPAAVLATATRARKAAPGETLVHTPLIKIGANAIEKDTMKAIVERRLKEVDWIVFTSRYGVHYFFELLKEAGTDLRSLLGAKIASVGPATTKALHDYCLNPDIESATESAEGLINYFAREEKNNGRLFLLPRSNKGLPELSEALRRQGHEVIDLPVYVNTDNDEARRVDLARFGKILFGSPSGVRAFEKIYGQLPEGTLLIARGKTTEKELRKIIDKAE